ncbi:MAG: hypothetical protein ACXAD7_07865 [Candidatus Kariarchaeaceae archaeon]
MNRLKGFSSIDEIKHAESFGYTNNRVRRKVESHGYTHATDFTTEMIKFADELHEFHLLIDYNVISPRIDEAGSPQVLEELVEIYSDILEKNKKHSLRWIHQNKIFKSVRRTNFFFKHSFILPVEEEYDQTLREIKNSRKSIKNELKSLKRQIAGKNKYFQPWDTILEILNKATGGIQISLARVSELAEISESWTESLINDILKVSPIGEYFKFEQTFVKKGIETKDHKQSRYDSLQICSNCQEPQSVLVRNCSNCGINLNYCEICKTGFFEYDIIAKCPHCSKIYHKSHLLEAIKISGKCPTCKEELVEKQIQ